MERLLRAKQAAPPEPHSYGAMGLQKFGGQTVPFSKPTNGFRLHYLRSGEGPPVVLVHGGPGDNKEYSALLPLLTPSADVVVPDLRGFGRSDKHLKDVGNAYALSGQVDGAIALIDELGISNVVLCGYDIGSFTVQTIAVKRPDLAKSLVIAPPAMGVGRRILEEKAVNAFLHAILYKTTLVEDLIDGKPDAVRAVLKESLRNWSAPGSEVVDALLDHLTENHSAPGAFVAASCGSAIRRGTPSPITPTRRSRNPLTGSPSPSPSSGPARIRSFRRNGATTCPTSTVTTHCIS
ncbi:alpha/beta fold hydrolase [Microbispora sp. ATCC PTA-5024]|uniref:alpha/beta fold hydrolase n=1 Tax=Microbispora sp. ATCC PTA-5024 TaxID=316330 RepID=UPI0012EE8467|nr:alpha/beta hydrolase [Microbispora sp. ATCC PTA-5024]